MISASGHSSSSLRCSSRFGVFWWTGPSGCFLSRALDGKILRSGTSAHPLVSCTSSSIAGRSSGRPPHPEADFIVADFIVGDISFEVDCWPYTIFRRVFINWFGGLTRCRNGKHSIEEHIEWVSLEVSSLSSCSMFFQVHVTRLCTFLMVNVCTQGAYIHCHERGIIWEWWYHFQFLYELLRIT